VAGGETKVAEASRGLKSTSPLPQQSEPFTKTAAPANKVEINPYSIDYVESAALKQKKDLSSPDNYGNDKKKIKELIINLYS